MLTDNAATPRAQSAASKSLKGPVLLTVGLLAIFVVTLVVTRSGDASPDSRLVVGDGADRLPSETLTDWVSYADQVSVVSVVGEAEIPPDPSVVDRGEGYIGRTVQIQIEQTIWARPQSKVTASGQIEFLADGWVLRDGQKFQFARSGGPRLTVGNRYLMPLTPFPEGWAPLSAGSTIELSSSQTTTQVAAGEPSPTISGLANQTPSSIASSLAATSPDPMAAKHFDLDPVSRWNAVLQDRGVDLNSNPATD